MLVGNLHLSCGCSRDPKQRGNYPGPFVDRQHNPCPTSLPSLPSSRESDSAADPLLPFWTKGVFDQKAFLMNGILMEFRAWIANGHSVWLLLSFDFGGKNKNDVCVSFGGIVIR